MREDVTKLKDVIWNPMIFYIFSLLLQILFNINSSPHKGSKYFLQVQGEEDAVPSAPQNLWWKPWKKETSKKLLKLVVVETEIYIHLYLLTYWVYTM